MSIVLATLVLLGANPVGDWEATLAPSRAVELRLILHVRSEPSGSLTASLDSLDEGLPGIKVDRVEVRDDAVELDLPSIQSEFRGKFAGDTIKGDWSKKGKSVPIVWTRQSQPTAAPELWEGKLKLNGGIELRLVIRTTRRPDGSLRATLDSPDQGAVAIKIDSATLDTTMLTFDTKAIQGSYSGTLNEAHDEATGTWTQLGRKMPLTLKKTTTLTTAKRPQTPAKPYPYREEIVQLTNPTAQITLGGTLTLPQGTGPFPAAVLISGSGPQDRDETLLGHKPFLVLADFLTRRGIAVLRYDDRGVGESKGDHSKATSEDFATDARAAIDWLKTRAEIDGRKIGLIGHSEGGLIGPMVAATTSDVAFLVLLAGPGVPGDEILARQGQLIARAAGASDVAVARSQELSRKILDLVRTEKDDAKATAQITTLVKAEIDAMPEAERKALGDDPSAAVVAQFAAFRTPWFAYFLTHDPRPTLEKVRCPVLALNGEKDLQVEPKQNLPEIARAFEKAGNKNVTIRELPGLNHLFQTCQTGAPSEYNRIEETMAPHVLTIVADWILDHTKSP